MYFLFEINSCLQCLKGSYEKFYQVIKKLRYLFVQKKEVLRSFQSLVKVWRVNVLGVCGGGKKGKLQCISVKKSERNKSTKDLAEELPWFCLCVAGLCIITHCADTGKAPHFSKGKV